MRPRRPASDRRRVLRASTLGVVAGTLLASALIAVPAVPRIAEALERPPAVVVREVRLGATSRILPGGGARSVSLPINANLVGASWRGSGQVVELRVLGRDGRWSAWVELHATPEEGPDPSSEEARAMRGRFYLANPVWVGDASRVQLRVPRSHDRHGHGDASFGATALGSLQGGESTVRIAPIVDLRLVAVNSTGSASRTAAARTRARAAAADLLGASRANAVTHLFPWRTRQAWEAAPPRATPARSDGVRAVVVHHTVSTNRYDCSSVPAMIRGIQRYHMASNGWNDIGYNVLVDRCGGLWEGRAGGLAQPVIGAHTYGFNTNTAGVALIGEHGEQRPAPAALRTLTRYAAWRLDQEHRDPRGRVRLQALASDRFQAGQQVWVRSIVGHRDLFRTACPGALAYREVAALRDGAWRHGGPKVANPRRTWLSLRPDGSVRELRVAAHSPVPGGWELRIERASDGALIGRSVQRAFSDSVVLSWSAESAAQRATPAWELRMRLVTARMGVHARPWQAPVWVPPPDPGFTLVEEPAFVARDLDPDPEVEELEWRLRARISLEQDATVTVEVRDAATGTLLWRPLDRRLVRAGSAWIHPPLPAADELPDGERVVRIVVHDPMPGRTPPVRRRLTLARDA